MMKQKPALDLSECDLLEAKDKLFAYVCAKATSWGMDPNIECRLLSPSQSHELGYGRLWRVMWEAGPHDWGVELSIEGAVTFVPLDGPWDRSTPEIVVGDPGDRGRTRIRTCVSVSTRAKRLGSTRP
jgi:hypothetical protein